MQYSVKEHFEKESTVYNDNIYKTIPKYDEMLFALVNSIDKERNAELNILDLGCGTGNASLRIKKNFPNSTITCLDLAENMINICKKNFKDFSNMKYIVGDFFKFDFEDEYDVVISSLAIHHLTCDEKKDLYLKIFNSLKNNGIFYNADPIEDDSDYLNQLNKDMWKSHLEKSLSETEIQEIFDRTGEQDKPSLLLEQLAWFNDIGFKEINVTWKYYGYAVYGGKKIVK